ncbi:hypothetical protein A7M82_03715 [Acinetobacter baumannii]|nr:hypothetical protein A7M82_03715 [Acinetobacter baumannii]
MTKILLMGVTLIQFLNLSDTLENLLLKKNVVIGKILLIKNHQSWFDTSYWFLYFNGKYFTKLNGKNYL